MCGTFRARCWRDTVISTYSATLSSLKREMLLVNGSGSLNQTVIPQIMHQEFIEWHELGYENQIKFFVTETQASCLLTVLCKSVLFMMRLEQIINLFVEIRCTRS